MSAITAERKWQIDEELVNLRWKLGMRQPHLPLSYVIEDQQIQQSYREMFGDNGRQATVDYQLLPRFLWHGDGGLRVWWYQWCSEAGGMEDYYLCYGPPVMPREYYR